jgi:hypothetical protein
MTSHQIVQIASLDQDRKAEDCGGWHCQSGLSALSNVRFHDAARAADLKIIGDHDDARLAKG